MSKRPDSDFVLDVTKLGRPCKESHKSYVVKQRNEFYSKFSLQIQQTELEDLRTKINEERHHIAAQELGLEIEQRRFLVWLKEQDEETKKFLTRAEESKGKTFEKADDTKALKSSITLLRSEIEKYESALKEYKEYEKFLHSIITPEGTLQEVYQQPKAILLVFRQIQNDCVALMRHNHELAEELKKSCSSATTLQDSMDKRIVAFRSPIDEIEKSISKEQRRIQTLQIMISQTADQRKMDEEKERSRVGNQIEDVYKTCVGEIVISIGVNRMLSKIEEKLFKLLETMKTFPLERLEAVEKAKIREQIRKKKDEKLDALKQRSFHRPPQKK